VGPEDRFEIHDSHFRHPFLPNLGCVVMLTKSETDPPPENEDVGLTGYCKRPESAPRTRCVKVVQRTLDPLGRFLRHGRVWMRQPRSGGPASGATMRLAQSGLWVPYRCGTTSSGVY